MVPFGVAGSGGLEQRSVHLAADAFEDHDVTLAQGQFGGDALLDVALGRVQEVQDGPQFVAVVDGGNQEVLVDMELLDHLVVLVVGGRLKRPFARRLVDDGSGREQPAKIGVNRQLHSVDQRIGVRDGLGHQVRAVAVRALVGERQNETSQVATAVSRETVECHLVGRPAVGLGVLHDLVGLLGAAPQTERKHAYQHKCSECVQVVVHGTCLSSRFV